MVPTNWVKICYSAGKSASLNPSFPPLIVEGKSGVSQGLVLGLVMELKTFFLGAAPIAAISLIARRWHLQAL
jgi:hypothetical protein